MPSQTMDDATVVIRAEAEAAAPGRMRRWLPRIFLAAGAGTFLLAVAGGGGIIVLSEDLPRIDSLADYQPHQASVVYGAKGEVVARFAKERRTVVPYARFPAALVNAVVAAEDDNFFEHEGLDYVGIARCAVKNLVSGRKVCGGSTITQQTVKTFFLHPKKTYTRKLREMILARRLEQALSKDDILFLYLNQIYYGHGAYGAQEAARVYFQKDVADLSVPQAALLAGLPQSPSRLDPYRHPERARKRRAYVLERMRITEKIDEPTYKAAVDSALSLAGDAEDNLDSNNYFAAQIRKLVTETVGEERLLSGGLKIYTGLRPELQREAEDAVNQGLEALDKRQGWRGPITHLERDAIPVLQAKLLEKIKAFAEGTEATDKDAPPAPAVIWDLSSTETLRAPVPLEQVLESARIRTFSMEKVYAGMVIEVDDAGQKAVVDLGGVTIQLPTRTGLGWARTFDIHRTTRRPRKPSDVLSLGDIVKVRALSVSKTDAILGVLEQTPKVQAALVSIDPHTREVTALVGGYGIGAGNFNRAVQARRQAGSTFKPFVYAAAFETKEFTPVSACLDAPRVYRDPWTQRSWKPQNYGRKFDGEITLRTALTLSKNLCSVELIDKIGVDLVLAFARRAGIESPLPRNLTLALGSGDVTPLEMTNAYATLAAGGRRSDPIFIRRIVDPQGTALPTPEGRPDEATIAPEVVYQITSLMQSVVEDGTAQKVKVLDRPVAGKTGTTNEARNAWFVGFTPDVVTGVWVGFDDNEPLGPHETGGRAAIPVWLQFMQKATEGEPVRDFVPPDRIVFASVDPKSGKLAPANLEGARNEPFIRGTEPTELVPSTAAPDRMMWEDMR